MSAKAPLVIIGAGPAGLIAAHRLATAGYEVHIYEQNKAAARKFLVAGHGGFNLTHSEDIALFIDKYDRLAIQQIVQYFDNHKLIAWLEQLGIPTYTGSSGKIFPRKDIKPIQVLQAILQQLKDLHVRIHYEHRLIDFDAETFTVVYKDEVHQQPYSRLILGLGGGSWAKTGSDAKWVDLLQRKSVAIAPLQAANSGLNTERDFSPLAGQVLKNICIQYGEHSKLGELVFTHYGIEGSPVYYMNRFIRQSTFPITLTIDLKPTVSVELLEQKLTRNLPVSTLLKNDIKLTPTALLLIKLVEKSIYTDPTKLAACIKNYPIEVNAFRPLDEVISTAGGVAFQALSPSLALQEYPNVHCIGEMLDWEAPTGGYLLQACFSTGVWVADQIAL